jgi:hypothetical protein
VLFYVWQLAFNAFFRYDILVNGDEIMKRSYVLTLIIALAAHSHAWDFFSSKPARPRVAVVESQERSGPAPICLSKQQQQKQNRFTCPDTSELYLSKMQWKTDLGWTGYQKSFSKGISHFMGAQWKGVGVGQVYCIYQPDDPSEFPIQLTSKTLYSRPDVAYWENAPRKDAINCISKQNDPCDCQFSRFVEEDQAHADDAIFGIEKK